MSRDLTVTELAKRIGVHRVTAGRLVLQGYFPNAYKTGSGGETSPWAVPESDIPVYMKTQPHPEITRRAHG
ncbi:helix-turn-helix transcriptional regulator [Acaricomes phytoseiuli]|uniref:helix-turn-helix transcriptional regulator n=1 Tax=Acaricomes phytoseiuli TaxID=291968 RepID=UPI00037F13D8|nr:helix-turn-helix domain-containing protein [Acaricomes phytoseiuli]